MTDRLPPLPSLRALTAELRALHDAWSHPDAGGEYVSLLLECDEIRMLIWDEADIINPRWRACAVGQVGSVHVVPRGEGVTTTHVYGHEYIPGSREVDCTPDWAPDTRGAVKVHVGSPFDATAAARRLLAAARDAGVR